MKNIYILKFTAKYVEVDGYKTIFGKIAYLSRELAEQNIDKFKTSCKPRENDFLTWDSNGNVSILEFDLFE